MLVNVCLDNIFGTTEHFVTKPVWFCNNISQSVMQKNWFAVLKVKVTARAYIIKI